MLSDGFLTTSLQEKWGNKKWSLLKTPFFVITQERWLLNASQRGRTKRNTDKDFVSVNLQPNHIFRLTKNHSFIFAYFSAQLLWRLVKSDPSLFSCCPSQTCTLHCEPLMRIPGESRLLSGCLCLHLPVRLHLYVSHDQRVEGAWEKKTRPDGDLVRAHSLISTPNTALGGRKEWFAEDLARSTKRKKM